MMWRTLGAACAYAHVRPHELPTDVVSMLQVRSTVEKMQPVIDTSMEEEYIRFLMTPLNERKCIGKGACGKGYLHQVQYL